MYLSRSVMLLGKYEKLMRTEEFERGLTDHGYKMLWSENRSLVGC